MLMCCDDYSAVAKTNTILRRLPGFPSDDQLASLLLKRGQNQLKSYAPRKNLTHEPTGGRVQSTFGQHSILSTTIPDGDTGDCHIIQDSRFQLSRTLRFRGAHSAAIGGRRFAESVCVR